MMRITVGDDTGCSLIKVEGMLVGPWVAELDHCWRQTRNCRPLATVRLDLNEATHIDAAGKQLLGQMHKAGATLIASSCLMKAVVQEIAELSAK
jgi:hypothetical protein